MNDSQLWDWILTTLLVLFCLSFLPKQIPMPAPPEVIHTPQLPQVCNVHGCGAAPNVYGSSPYGECNVYGCP